MTSDRIFLGAALLRDDLPIVVSAREMDLEARVEKTQAHVLVNGSWRTQNLPMTCVAVSTAVLDGKAHLYYLGHDGILMAYSHRTWSGEPLTCADGTENEMDPDAPNDQVPMRAMACDGSRLMAVGMARFGYLKDLVKGEWIRFDQGMFVPRGERAKLVGLTDVTFGGDGWLVAVGYQGEIWHRAPDADAWQLQQAPAGPFLESVAAHPERNEFTILGPGAVIQGSPRTGWQVVEGAPRGLRDVTYFRGEPYISSNQGMYRLRHGRFEHLAMDSGGRRHNVDTAGYLAASPAGIWSAGRRHVYHSTDGDTWVAQDPP
jgi:hypothetical protein